MYDLSCYDRDFSISAGDEARRMSEWWMPLLRKTLPFDNFIDIGCGEGWYVDWCEMRDITAVGIDGSEAAVERARELNSDIRVMLLDIRKAQSFQWPGKWDLAMCFEVAEHIEAEYADRLVGLMTSAAPVVVMTAATPGQGGLQHVNEQPREYWHKKMAARGFAHWPEKLKVLLDGIERAVENGEYVTPWLAKNLEVYRRAR